MSISHPRDQLRKKNIILFDISNKMRDLFKVKLYTIRSETKKKERVRARLQIFINPNTDREVKSDPN